MFVPARFDRPMRPQRTIGSDASRPPAGRPLPSWRSSRRRDPGQVADRSATTAAGRSDRSSPATAWARRRGAAASANDIRHRVAFDATLTMARRRRCATRCRGLRPDRLEMTLGRRADRATDVIAYRRTTATTGAAGWVYCPTRCATGRQLSRAIAGASRQELHFNLNARMPSSSRTTGAATTSPATSSATPSGSGTGATRRRASARRPRPA